jgi:hypothetical protein
VRFGVGAILHLGWDTNALVANKAVITDLWEVSGIPTRGMGAAFVVATSTARAQYLDSVRK